MKNKFKIFATTAGLAAIAAPIVTLASCNKGGSSPIIIDEKEKVKELEKGTKEATFAFQLSTAIEESDTIQVELKDIVSSQTGFTVQKAAEPEYTVGSKEVKQKIMIAPSESSDTIIPEGTNVTFSVEIKRLNGKGEETASVTIKDFKLTYVPPFSGGLTLEGEKIAASNPGYGETTATHTYQFAIGSSIKIDEEATYEVELTKLATSTSGVDVKYVETTYDKTNNKLLVKLEMSKKTALAEGDQVNFDFTISSSKEGKELWRQSFSGYGIWYLSRHMYIFNEDQPERNLAGVNTHYLFIATAADLDWNTDPYKAHVEITDVSSAGTTLTYNDSDVTKYKGEKYWYFIVPLTIGGTLPADGTEVTYTATLKATVDGQPVEDEFDNIPFTYVTQKIDDTAAETIKTGTVLGDENSFVFNLPLVDFQAQNKMEFAVIPTSVPASTQVKAGTIEMTAEGAKPHVFIESSAKEATATFELVLRGYKNDKVVWTQYVEGFKLTYIDPIEIAKKSIETGKETDNGDFDYTIQNITTGGTIAPTTANALNVTTGRNVQGVEIAKPASNKIHAILEPVATMELSYDSYATFNLQVAGTYTLGTEVTNWTKTFKECRLDYFGTLEYDETCPRSQVAEPGTNLCCYVFDRKVKAAQIDEVLVTTDQTSQTTRKAKFHGWSETEDKYLVYVNMESTQPETDPLQDGDQAQFSIAFKGKSPLGTSWAKTFGNGGQQDPHFEMTYTSSVRAKTKDITTLPKQNKANITLNANKALANNEYYKVKVTGQTLQKGIVVSVDESAQRRPSDTTFEVELTLTKEQPLAKGDATQFSIAVEKYTNDELTDVSYISTFTVSYTDAYIKWNEADWYVYQSKSIPSGDYGYGDVRFELANKLSDGQTLSVSVETNTGDYTLEAGSVSVTGTTVTIPMVLHTTTDTPSLIIGKKAISNLKIVCKDSSQTQVWAEPIDNFELYMMSSFTATTQAISTTTTTSSLKVNMSAYFPTGSEMTMNARCSKVGWSKDNLNVTCSEIAKAEPDITLTLNFSGSATPEKNDFVTFNIDFIVKVQKGENIVLVTVPMFNGPVTMTKIA